MEEDWVPLRKGVEFRHAGALDHPRALNALHRSEHGASFRSWRLRAADRR